MQYAYNKSKIIGYKEVGGIIGSLVTGTVSNTYNIGTIQAGSTINVGNVSGYTTNSNMLTYSGSTTESTMKGWNQTTINSNIGSGFVKKTNSLPILNVTIPIYNNFVF